MRSLTLVALLLLQCWMPLLALEDESQYWNLATHPSVGTTQVKGSTLRIFEISGGIQASEPRISFGETCDSLRYNSLYQKHQLTLPIHIEANTLKSGTDSSKKVGQVTLTALLTEVDKGLAAIGKNVTVMTQLTSADKGQLIFLCDAFSRCQELSEDVNSNPEDFQRAVRFIPAGRLNNQPVRFAAIHSATSPVQFCTPGQWVVFQRRVDGSLSFAQNWDSYVKGFGNPSSNYWMGLNRLFARTVTSAHDATSRCRLRVETEDFNGNKYWGEYGMFQILGPENNYRLRIANEVLGTQTEHFSSGHHQDKAFSTYDKDNDNHGGSCSQLYGYSGWWFHACGYINLNGAYLTDKNVDNNLIYMSIHTRGKQLPMKSSVMMFKC